LVRAEIFEHSDWVELDRGTLSREDAIVRAARRTGLAERKVAALFRQVPIALVAIPSTVEILYRLKRLGHALFCLSNMHEASLGHIERTCTFWNVFAGAVFSCRVQLCKPEPAIYSYLLNEYGLIGPDTVFIDDTEVNLMAAAKFGLKTLRFETPSQCELGLHALGCI
jgi:putative hydrolase of the HAD superfamily